MNAHEALVGTVEKAIGERVVGCVQYQHDPAGVAGVLYNYVFKPLLRVRVLIFSFETLAEKLFKIEHGYLALTARGNLMKVTAGKASAVDLTNANVEKHPSPAMKGWYRLRASGQRWPLLFAEHLAEDGEGNLVTAELAPAARQLANNLTNHLRATTSSPALGRALTASGL